MKTAALILSFFFTSAAFAQVLRSELTLLSQDDVVADIPLESCTILPTNSMQAVTGNSFRANLSAIENSGTGTLDVTVYTCPDKSSTTGCSALAPFSQCTATCSESLALTPTATNVYPYFCAVVDVGATGSPNYDVDVDFLYE